MQPPCLQTANRLKVESTVYGILITTYLFLGGAASGSLLIMCSWSLIFHYRKSHRSPRIRRAFRALKSAVYTISFILLAISVLCLAFDLASPHRAYLLFMRPHPTPITFGAFALTFGLAIGFLLVVANLLRPRAMNGYVKGALEALGVVCSICIMAYTGVFLYTQPAVAIWHTVTIVPLFIFSSISSGISVVLLIDYFIQGKVLLLRTVQPMQKLHLVCLALESAALAAFAFAMFGNPHASKSVDLLLNPDMLGCAGLGIVGMGIIAPACLETYALTRGQCRSIPISDVICLIGGFCLRFCIIMCGAH